MFRCSLGAVKQALAIACVSDIISLLFDYAYPNRGAFYFFLP